MIPISRPAPILFGAWNHFTCLELHYNQCRKGIHFFEIIVEKHLFDNENKSLVGDFSLIVQNLVFDLALQVSTIPFNWLPLIALAVRFASRYSTAVWTWTKVDWEGVAVECNVIRGARVCLKFIGPRKSTIGYWMWSNHVLNGPWAGEEYWQSDLYSASLYHGSRTWKMNIGALEDQFCLEGWFLLNIMLEEEL